LVWDGETDCYRANIGDEVWPSSRAISEGYLSDKTERLFTLPDNLKASQSVLV
jgi:hypothetical protein